MNWTSNLALAWSQSLGSCLRFRFVCSRLLRDLMSLKLFLFWEGSYLGSLLGIVIYLNGLFNHVSSELAIDLWSWVLRLLERTLLVKILMSLLWSLPLSKKDLGSLLNTKALVDSLCLWMRLYAEVVCTLVSAHINAVISSLVLPWRNNSCFPFFDFNLHLASSWS